METPQDSITGEVMSASQAEKVLAATPPEAIAATNQLINSFTRSRRGLLRTALAGAMGTALVGAAALNAPAHAAAMMHEIQSSDTVQDILTVARTAEQLAVTFYTNGIDHHNELGISGANLKYLQAAVVEEQIHLNFFAANGGGSLTTSFSFPHGKKTFNDLETFIATQQQLEGVFDSAFLAAISEFAQLGLPRLAQIAGQIACVEAEHRVLGRVIGNYALADNIAFEPVLIPTVGQAPGVVAAAGYLSPVPGNRYSYHPAASSYPHVIYTQP